MQSENYKYTDASNEKDSCCGNAGNIYVENTCLRVYFLTTIIADLNAIPSKKKKINKVIKI